MSTSPKVSILVPIYGVEKYIERCAISLFEQSYDNIEYIFVNDCTKDRSIDILQSVIARYPNRRDAVRIIKHECNRGLAATRNTAVAAATGDFIMHVDSDDWIEVKTVESCIEVQKRNNADIVTYGLVEHYSPERNKKRMIPNKNVDSFAIEILKGNTYPVIWNKLIRKSLYIDYHIACLDGINMGEDLQVTPLLCYNAKRIEVIHDCFYHYNLENVGAYTKSFSAEKVEQTWATLLHLTRYFSDKGKNYNNAVSIARLNFLARSLLSCVRAGDKACFIWLKSKLSSENRKEFSNITCLYRASFYIKNYHLLRTYSIVMQLLKRLVCN